MAEVLFWSGVLRFGQSLLAAAPTIVIGLIVSGVFLRLMGHENIRRLFGGSTWRSLPQAWAVGMLLPVCSLGVIPVARQMRRAGLTGGTILAFALTAPLFNPLSMLYGLTLSEPLVIFAFALCSLLIVTILGFAWDRLFPGSATEEPAPPRTAPGLKRLLSILVTGAREAAGPAMLFILVGIAGVTMLGLVLPPGSMQHSFNGGNRWAPLTMTGIAVPVYATPMLAMSQLGSMFQHANSVGAAFVLLSLGTGLNLGLLLWMIRQYGLRRTGSWLAVLIVVVLGLAYTVDQPLHPTEIEAADHTHAFDIYCRPFHAGANGMPAIVWSKLVEKSPIHEQYGLAALAILVLGGVVLAAVDPKRRLEAWIESAGEQAISRYDRVVPGPVLGGVALVGLVVASVVGCYTWYPPPGEVLEEMQIARTEAFSAALTGDVDHAEYWLPVLDDWARRLQVGVYLRQGNLSRYHRHKASVFRFRLELLEHELEDGSRDEVSEAIAAAAASYHRLQFAYTEEL